MLCVLVALTFAVPVAEQEGLVENQPIVQDVELVNENDDLEGAEHHYGGYGKFSLAYFHEL